MNFGSSDSRTHSVLCLTKLLPSTEDYLVTISHMLVVSTPPAEVRCAYTCTHDANLRVKLPIIVGTFRVL